MAMAIFPNGKWVPLVPPNGKSMFSMIDFGLTLGGPVDLFFVSDYWVFCNRLGKELAMPFNQKATEQFKTDIYGLCIICKMEELPPQFFVPSQDELEKANKDLSEMIRKSRELDEPQEEEDPMLREAQQQAPPQGKDDTSGVPPEVLELIMENGYNVMLTIPNLQEENGRLTSLVIVNDGTTVMTVPPSKEKRLLMIDRMLEHFQEREEYEKCSKLRDLRDYVEKF